MLSIYAMHNDRLKLQCFPYIRDCTLSPLLLNIYLPLCCFSASALAIACSSARNSSASSSCASRRSCSIRSISCSSARACCARFSLKFLRPRFPRCILCIDCAALVSSVKLKKLTLNEKKFIKKCIIV